MKKILLASLALSFGLGAATAARADDTLAGVVVGGGIGGLVGNAVGGRDGAIVGGLLGAVTGAAIANSNEPRYTQVGYGGPAYYARPAPVYYAPRPVYYGRPAVVTPVYHRGHPHYRHVHHDRHDHRHWR